MIQGAPNDSGWLFCFAHCPLAPPTNTFHPVTEPGAAGGVTRSAWFAGTSTAASLLEAPSAPPPPPS